MAPIRSLPTQTEVRSDPEKLYRALAVGIAQFREHHVETEEHSSFRETVRNGQKPLAYVLQCCDGRQPAHVIFDMPPGMVFCQTSIAGFVHEFPYDPLLWASMEYAVKELRVPAVVVLGHSGCGGAMSLVKNCWNATLEEVVEPTSSDTLMQWLSSAHALTQRVLHKARKTAPRLTQNAAMPLVAQEIVRDSVAKARRNLDYMEHLGNLDRAMRPVVTGMFFDMEKAQLLHLQQNGEFSLLSEVLAHKAETACGCERPDKGSAITCDSPQL